MILDCVKLRIKTDHYSTQCFFNMRHGSTGRTHFPWWIYIFLPQTSGPCFFPLSASFQAPEQPTSFTNIQKLCVSVPQIHFGSFQDRLQVYCFKLDTRRFLSCPVSFRVAVVEQLNFIPFFLNTSLCKWSLFSSSTS